MTAETSASRPALIPVVPLGMALGLFLVISYLACIALYLIAPEMASGHAVLVLFLPGFKLLNWASFFLGLVESFGYDLQAVSFTNFSQYPETFFA